MASGTATTLVHVELGDPGRPERGDDPAGAHHLGGHWIEHRGGEHALHLVDDRPGQPDTRVAGQGPRRRRQRAGQLPALLGQRPQLVAVERLGRGAQLLGHPEHRVDLLALAADEQVHRPCGDRRLLQLLDLSGQLLVADLLGGLVARLGEGIHRPGVQRVRDSHELIHGRPPSATGRGLPSRHRTGSPAGRRRARDARTSPTPSGQPDEHGPRGWPSCRSGPATPVVARAQSTSRRSRTPVAICTAHSAEMISVAVTPSRRRLSSVA